MSNLTEEQIRNLRADGYIIRERGSKTEVYKELPTGAVRYTLENNKVYKCDSYFGNPRDPDNHDRFTVRDGKIDRPHGFNHER